MPRNVVPMIALAALAVAALFVAGARSTPAPAPGAVADASGSSAPADEGRAAFARHCGDCHGARIPLRPALTETLRAHHRHATVPEADRAALLGFLRAQDEARKARTEEFAAPAADPGPARGTNQRPALPPRWVFDTWKWRNEHASYREVYADVDAMEQHDIPFTAYIIDSPWETGYNTFEFYAPRFAQAGEPVTGRKIADDLHRRGKKLILWIAPIINDGSQSNDPWDPDAERRQWNDAFQRGLFSRHPGFLLLRGNGKTFAWWKGRGSHLDFENPAAVRYWYALLDKALVDIDADGFKVDGGWPLGQLQRLYFHHTAAQVLRRTAGRGTTISRPLGGTLETSLSHWTGDEDPTFDGMRHAMRRMRVASKTGYSTVGSDIGGFKGSPSKEVLIRWAQLGCFSGIMELGGGGVHEPWEFDAETVALYRRMAKLRHELVPYLHHFAHVAHNTGAPLMRWGDGAAQYQFQLGDHFYVAPVSSAEAQQAGRTTVFLPAGEWIDFWRPERRVTGPATVEYEHPTLEEFPLYVRAGSISIGELGPDCVGDPFYVPVRAGSIIPREVWDDTFPHAVPGAAGALTLDVRLPADSAATTFRSEFFWGDGEGVAPTVFMVAQMPAAKPPGGMIAFVIADEAAAGRPVREPPRRPLIVRFDTGGARFTKLRSVFLFSPGDGVPPPPVPVATDAAAFSALGEVAKALFEPDTGVVSVYLPAGIARTGVALSFMREP